jgi:hypothetical protein
VTINSGGIINMNASSKTLKSLAGAGSVFNSMVAANATAATLNLVGTTGSTTFSGTISNGPGTGALSVTKSGASTQVLSGTNSYTGATTVSGGELRVNGSLANTAVTVSNTNTVLSGTGSIGGATVIQTGAILAPGANTSGNYSGTGTLTFSSGLTINSGAKLNFDTGDLIAVTGGVLTLNGGAITFDNGATLSSATTYTLFDYTGGSLAGSFTNLSLTNSLGSGLTANFGTSGSTVTLTLSAGAVPAAGSLTISAPSRAMAGSSVSITGSLANSGTATSNLNVALTSTGTTTVSSLTPSSGTVAPGANTTVGGSFTAGSAGTTNSVQLTNTDASASPTTAVSNTATTQSVADRVVTATSVNLGSVLVGTATGSQISNLSTTGTDSNSTRITLNTGVTTNGVTISGGVNTLYNSATSTDSRSVAGTFTTSGSKSGSVTLTATGEGLTGESPINTSVSYTANVYQAASLSGTYLTSSTAIGGTSTGTVDTGATLSVANAATSDGGQRAAAAIVSNTLTGDSAWSVSGSGLNVGTVINAGSSTSATSNFSSTGKLNGTYTATLTLGLQHNDQTISGTLANDLGSATWQFSRVVSGQIATSGTKAQTNGNSLVGVGLTNSGGNGTNATILAGTSDGTTTSISFGGTNSAPNDASRVADVTDVTTGTGAFVLQLSYNDVQAALLPGGPTSLFLAWHATPSASWINAILGNTGNTSYAALGFFGSYAQFLATNGLGAAALSTFMGAYGVDVTNKTVWAVLNHNSSFSVVPEPSTYAMLVGGLFLVGLVIRRKRKI